MINLYRRPRRSTATTLLLVIIGILSLVSPGLAQRGDTTWVRAFDSYLWTWYGSQNRWAVFPDATHRSEKILMHYRLKCPTGGCGEWDYTSNVFIMDHTGRIDSSIQSAPSFRVDGGVVDSIAISARQTYTYAWNTSKRKVDTTANPALNIVFYRDPAHVWRATDSIRAYQAGYYSYSFSATGVKTDSAWVAADSTLHVTKQDAYLPFEVIVPYEIGRFITPYGKWFAKDREFDWVFDVTEYAYMLHDSVDIQTRYEGYSQGSIYSLDFEMIEGIPAVDVFRIENLYDGAWAYGNPGDPIETHLPARTVLIDPAATNTRLKIVTTGHGFGGTEDAAEFSNKTHSVTVDGTQRFTQHLWRDDCGQNPVYPQAGTWYFQRGGWCPGDLVRPDYFNLTPFVTPGSNATIDYNMQPYVNADLSHGASYIIHAQVQYATGPNFRNDAEVMEIKTPNDAFMYNRMNPVCSNSNPLIVIRNRGSQPLKRATITYGIGEAEQLQTYEWTGNLGFLETAEVTLPAADLGEGAATFTVMLASPNGVADEYPSNDTAYAHYELPKSYGNKVYLQIRTDDYGNLAPDYNGISYQLLDLAGNLLYEGGNFVDKYTHRDTFDLPDGCYQFIIKDDVIGDGLLPIQGTAGSYSLKDNKNQTIINGAASGPSYLASFGDREITTFIVKSTSRVENGKVGSLDAVKIFPNPTQGEISIDLGSIPRSADASITVHSILGERVVERPVTAADPSIITVDLSAWPAGSYVVTVRAGDVVRSEQVVVGE